MVSFLNSAFFYFFGFTIILSVVVFCHEFGHYIIAKKSGVFVEEFSIGFGPSIFQIKTSSGTVWKFSLIPLGGYVKMMGDAEVSSFAPVDNKKIKSKDLEKCFFNKSNGVKSLISIGGPLANYILGFLLFFAVYAFYGVESLSPIVGGFTENSPSEIAGLKKGDKFLFVNHYVVKSFQDVRMAISNSSKTDIPVTVERGEDVVHLFIKANFVKQGLNGGFYSIGVIPTQSEIKKISVLDALKKSFSTVWDISYTSGKIFFQIITFKQNTSSLGGPIQIAKMSGEALRSGLSALLLSMALLSISLGFINLMPIPVLDGGHILTYGIDSVWKKIFKKSLPNSFSTLFYWSGLAIVICLMSIALLNDFMSIVR